MTERYQIIATPAFKLSLKRLAAFLERKYGKEVAINSKSSLKKAITLTLLNNPYLGPVSERLASVGEIKYRQLLVDEHNLLFYRVDNEKGKLILLLAMDSRQSMEQLLIDIALRL